MSPYRHPVAPSSHTSLDSRINAWGSVSDLHACVGFRGSKKVEKHWSNYYYYYHYTYNKEKRERRKSRFAEEEKSNSQRCCLCNDVIAIISHHVHTRTDRMTNLLISSNVHYVHLAEIMS